MNRVLVVNGYDISYYEKTNQPFNFKFAEAPGSVTHLSLDTLPIFSPKSGEIDPLHPYSPLNPIMRGVLIPITITDDKNPLLVRTGVITHAPKNSGEIVLFIEEDIQTILDKNMVLVSYSQKTPVELLKLIVESYGITFNLSNYFEIRQSQEDDGLLFDFNFGVGSTAKLMDIINQICKAGFMRAAIYNSIFYVLGRERGEPALTILPQEIHSLPTQTQQVIELHNGGQIQWLVGTVNVEPDTGKNNSLLSLDYSSSSILTLNNPSGAYSLIEYYSTRDELGRYYECLVDSRVVKQYNPGTMFRFKPPVFHPNKSINARLLGREMIEYNQHSQKCLWEVFYV
jgi:hypothetical protein